MFIRMVSSSFLPTPRVNAGRTGVWLLALGLGCSSLARADDSLQKIFTPDEYQGAGLEKLSPEEQAVLLRALHQRGLGNGHQAVAATPVATATAAAAATPPPAKKGLWARVMDFGAEQLPVTNAKDLGEVTEVDAQLTEPFEGLTGKTIFHLDNGQVWQQRAGEEYFLGKAIPNPKVVMMRTRFGYRIKIPEVGPAFDVAVKRIK
jgi:hypothetical protein